MWVEFECLTALVTSRQIAALLIVLCLAVEVPKAHLVLAPLAQYLRIESCEQEILSISVISVRLQELLTPPFSPPGVRPRPRSCTPSGRP